MGSDGVSFSAVSLMGVVFCVGRLHRRKSDLASQLVDLAERTFPKKDVVADGPRADCFRAHLRSVVALGDELLALCQDYRRAVVCFRHIWVRRHGVPSDPARLDSLFSLADAGGI